MSKFDEAMDGYMADCKKLGIDVDATLLKKVAKGLGPSIYRADASKVSGTDPDELARVKKNFLIGKLGLKDGPKLDEGINAAIETMGKSNRNKQRAIFYYLLVKHFRKASVYK